MLPYLLKRGLVAIPFLWLMATLIFLLSRLLPGSFGEERILQEKQGFYSKASESGRQQAYLDYLRKTGQDLPLFYFSLSPTLPSSLMKASGVPAERFLWFYGDTPALRAFIETIHYIEQQLAQHPQERIAAHLEVLYQSREHKERLAAISAIVQEAKTEELREAASHLLVQLQTMQPRPFYAYLLPTFTWNSSQNQYHQWLLQMLQGDLGTSYRNARPVHELLWEAVGNTLWLLLSSMIITFLLALEFSILLVQDKGRGLRRYVLPAFFVIDSIPTFVLALLLLILFANPDFLQLFPVFGMGYYVAEDLSLLTRLGQWLLYMTLPLLCLVLTNLPYITNQVYNTIQETMQADYTRTARAKGLAQSTVVRKHAVRNALLPLITMVSDALPALVAGSVIVETIFAIPGIGRLLVESVQARDYPVLVAIVLLTVFTRVLAYLLADVAYSWADPRIKHKLA